MDAWIPGTININTDYNWGDFSKVTTNTGKTFNYLNYINKAYGTKMTSSELAALIVIHELRHQNIPKPSDAETKAANLEIYNACIK